MPVQIRPQFEDGAGLQGNLGQESTVRTGILQGLGQHLPPFGLDRRDSCGVLLEDALVRHASKARAAARHGITVTRQRALEVWSDVGVRGGRA